MNRSNGHALVRVLDTGVGIAPHDRPHIFEQFYRGNPIMPGGALIDVRGTGLGLFIADQVIRAHDGHINVDSKVGKGSQFTIYLPLSEDASNGSSTNEHRDD
jgi:two-component system sensor histidine kinase VicK